MVRLTRRRWPRPCVLVVALKPLQTVQGVARGKNASPGDELIEVSLTPTPTSRPDRNEQQNTQTASAGNRPERATVGPMREDESKTVSVKPLEESPTEAPALSLLPL